MKLEQYSLIEQSVETATGHSNALYIAPKIDTL